MKKTIGVVIAFLFCLFLFVNTSYGLTGTLSSNKTSVKKDEEIILTIAFDEKVVAANFNINYDSSVFKFVEGVNINAAEKNGVVACIYADSTLNGTNSFSIKFKAIKDSGNATFSINDAKIREKGKDESATTSQIKGLSGINVEIKTDNTPSKLDNTTDPKQPEPAKKQTMLVIIHYPKQDLNQSL